MCTVIATLEQHNQLHHDELMMKNLQLETQLAQIKEQVTLLQTNFMQQTQQTNSLIATQQRLTDQLLKFLERNESTNNSNTNSNNNTNLFSNNNTLIPNNNTVVVINNTPNTVYNNNNYNQEPTPINTINQVVTNDHNTNTTNNNQVVQCHGNAIAQLRNVPRRPPVPTSCPTTWVGIAEEWVREDLSSFEVSGHKFAWDTTERSRFARRLRFMKQLRRLSSERKQSINEVAVILDIEKNMANNKYSMTEHLSRIKATDCTIKKRKRT